MISNINTLLAKQGNVPLWSFTSTVSKEMNNLRRLLWIFIGNWVAAACYSYGWFYPGYELQLTTSYGWLEFQRLDTTYAATDSSCNGWFETCDQSTTSRILTPMPPDSCYCLSKRFQTEAVFQRCSIKKGVLKSFSKFTKKWKLLRWSLVFNTNEACKFIKKETPTQVFSCKLAKFLRTPFFIEHL